MLARDKVIESTKKSKIFGARKSSDFLHSEIKNFACAPRIHEILEGIEFGLLSTLFDYIVPFLDKKFNLKTKEALPKKNAGNLEYIVEEAKPKISRRDIKELENLLLKNPEPNIRTNKNISINSNNEIIYSLNFARKKRENKTGNPSVSINYEENENWDKLKISVKKAGEEIYSAETIDKKEPKDKVATYSINISYVDNYAEERLAITYRQQLKSYMQQHIADKEDMTNRVPLKWLNILPETMMGGVLGFTYLGENFMGRRADLTGKTARMVDIHESIHTPDEYETVCLTRWIMSKERSKYIK